MTKKRVRRLVNIERTDIGEQNHIVWYEDEEVEESAENVADRQSSK